MLENRGVTGGRHLFRILDKYASSDHGIERAARTCEPSSALNLHDLLAKCGIFLRRVGNNKLIRVTRGC